jgi:pimeloyl-ACP methyl ester carboxylesterase
VGALMAGLATLLFIAPPPGRLVDVGGYRVHIYCTGAGTPTVMIIGGFSFNWGLVQPEVAKFTRVCTYDASGTAWSDPGPKHPTCSGRVNEIHQLLKAAKIDGPHVLAGFSIGAFFARLYAKQYPDGIAGMVIVDHAFLPAKKPTAPIVDGPDSLPVLISATPPIANGVEDEPGYNKLPQSIKDLNRWAAPISPGRPTANMAEECNSELGNATLGELPLIVVSTANDSRGYPELQAQLLALSHKSKQLIAGESFHSIEISQPEVVIRAIRLAVEASRK